MWYYGLDPTMLLVLPGILLAMIASFRVQHTFSKYAAVGSRNGWTASAMAQDMLYRAGIEDVRVERVAGRLTDHFDPRERVLRLSQDVYDSGSIAALGVAAHEVGHVFQYEGSPVLRQETYGPVYLRNALVPVANIGSQAAFPLFFIGLLLSWEPLLWIGIAAFAVAVLFYLVTLPVEFNASSRALISLEQGGYLNYEENRGAAAVLRAASWTYIASALTALLQLLRLLTIAGVGRRRD
ncbi:MAG TPA: zinc metallopeptidase [Clostridia bacterium]|nr:zinc metallopeptidase [Clostridia bacterium]